MPPRWLCVLIVAAWLLLTGWLFEEELLPRLLPGQPPPVTIDPTEEAKVRRVPTLWTVYQDGHVVCIARTRIEHPRRDVFDMIVDFPLTEAPALAAASVGAPTDNPFAFALAILVAAQHTGSPPSAGDDRGPAFAAAAVGAPIDNPFAFCLAVAAAQYAVSPAMIDRPRTSHLPLGPFNLLGLSSVYRVNGDGDLLSFEARLTAAPSALGALEKAGLDGVRGVFGVTTYGEVRGGRLHLTRRWGSGDGPGEPYEDLPIARGAAVVLPLHPARRIRGVKAGQSWRAVLVDPFASALTGEVAVVRAEVRPTTESLKWGRRGEVDCLVIDYRAGRMKVSTWVNPVDGNVMAQESTLEGTRWEMYRH